MKLVVAAFTFAALSFHLVGAQWSLVRNAHFEVYAHSEERDAETTLLWLERLRAFFIRAGVKNGAADLNSHRVVRVIVFDSPGEYSRFRPNPGADAYFLSSEARDYLVLPDLGPGEFGVAAHEYAHLVLHSLGISVPPWLAEGIAEFFSTVRIRDQECFIGGDLPGRSEALRRSPWIPLQDLFSAASATQSDRRRTELFYAESWIVTEMLIFSPAYAQRFFELLNLVGAGSRDPKTIERVYGEPLNRMLADAHEWSNRPRTVIRLAGVSIANEKLLTSILTDGQTQMLLADLLLASGKLAEAQKAYEALAEENNTDAGVHAALGSIALRQGHKELARLEWKKATQLGTEDPILCYQYAILAEDGKLPTEEIREALTRAVNLDPDFDDARYKLALVESNSGQFEAAVNHLRRIRFVGSTRAYGYWLALASALSETDDRESAKEAADKALDFAATSEERATAKSLAYIAVTDLTVQLSRDANGNLQVVTARKPHGAEWNPFIEPGDRILSLEGQIRVVKCTAGRISGFKVGNALREVELELPDPTHVLMRGGIPEFVCGAVDGRSVLVEYAASDQKGVGRGILRGMEFK